MRVVCGDMVRECPRRQIQSPRITLATEDNMKVSIEAAGGWPSVALCYDIPEL